MEVPATIFIAIGAVLAAFISGIFAFINLITSKDQKTSEFRQSWIDGLRTDVSRFVGLIDHMASLMVYYMGTCNSKEETQKRFDKSLHDNHDMVVEIRELHTKILLRINPVDDIELIRKVNEVHSLFNNSNPPESSKDIDEKISSLVTESQILLKKEWRRVKRGEPSFWITKYISILAILIVVCFGVWSLNNKKPTIIEQSRHNKSLQPTANASAE